MKVLCALSMMMASLQCHSAPWRLRWSTPAVVPLPSILTGCVGPDCVSCFLHISLSSS
jgi:hypothetical protein